MLDCELVQGTVPVGVCPTLPLDDVVMIWGNDLAGSAVWADVPPSVVVSKPLASGEPDESGLGVTRGVPACAVMHAQSRSACS